MRQTLKCMWLAATALPLLAGCGLADTAATGAVAAQEAQQAQQAKATEERYRKQLEAAQQASQEHRDAALKEADQ